MKTLKKDWTILIILFIPIVYFLLIWPELPQKVPISWDFEGNVNQYGSKNTAPIYVVLMPVLIYALLAIAPIIDPKKRLSQMGSKYYKLKAVISFFMVLLSTIFLYQIQSKDTGFNSSLIFIIIGLLISLLGNYFKTIKPNYFIGIRTPWTLESESIWKEVHATAGIIWFITGIIIIMLSLIITPKYLQYVMGAIILIITLVPVIQSFILFKNKQQ